MTGAIRPFVALAWRWTLRSWLAYLGAAAIPAIVSSLIQPIDTSEVGSLAALLVTYLVWLVALTPALLVVGVTWAGIICLSLRISHGGRRASAGTAGVFCTLVVVAATLILSDPRLIDLLFYSLLGIGLGIVASALTWRDTARIAAVSSWIAQMRQEQSMRGIAPREHG